MASITEFPTESATTAPRHLRSGRGILSSRSSLLAAVGIGFVACIVSAFAIRHLDPGAGGLLGALSPAWYAGLGLLVLACALVRPRSELLLAMPFLALQLALTLTPAIVYDEPRYAWTAKHVGVTSYILAHGSVNSHADIYQAWPGLFAGMAWIAHVAGITDPMAIARWWPPVIDVATLMLFRSLAGAFFKDSRRSWFAAAVFVLGNTIGQDYYSPQSAGFLLAIALFTIAIRRTGAPRSLTWSEWLVVGGIAVAIAITHQLTPYMTTATLTVLVVFRYARSRLLPLVAFIPAAAWAIIHLSIVRRYFKISTIGAIATNILPLRYVTPGIHRQHLINVATTMMTISAAVIALAAGVAILQGLKTGRSWALGLCALSGAGLLVASNYGNEGVLRVLLFALPWLAILVADVRWPSFARSTPWIVLLPLLLACYLYGDLGLDQINAVRPGDLAAERFFENTAPRGSTLFGFGNGYAPIKSTNRYNQFKFFGVHDLTFAGNTHGPFNGKVEARALVIVLQQVQRHQPRGTRVYVFAGQEAAVNADENGLFTLAQYRSLTAALGRTPGMTIVDKTGTATLFGLSPIAGASHAGGK